LPGWEVSAIHVDGVNGDRRIYAGTTHYSYGATIRASDDMGKTWQQMEARPTYAPEKGFKTTRFWQLASNPHQPGMLYAGIDEAGLFISKDRAQSWEEVKSLSDTPDRAGWAPGNGGLCLHTILFDRENPKRMWVGISAVGIFRSDDAGNTWKDCTSGLHKMESGMQDKPQICCIHKIVQDPKDTGTLYCQHHPGVYKSLNAGDTWEPIEEGLPGNFGFPMVVSKSGNLFVVPLETEEHRYVKNGKFQIYRSTNSGKSWQPCVKGFPAEPTFAGVLRDSMTGDGLKEGGVYLGTTSGEIFHTRDDGDSWSKIDGVFPRILCVRAYVFDDANQPAKKPQAKTKAGARRIKVK